MTSIPSFIKVILDGVDISQAEEINLEIGEKSPGGFDVATMKFCDLGPPDLTAPILIQDWRAQQTIYTGRVGDVELANDGYAITCGSSNLWGTDRRLGVGEVDTSPSDAPHKRVKFPSGTAVMDIARYAMSRLLGGNVYDSGHIIDAPMLQLFEDSQDFAGQTFEDIMAWLSGLTSYFVTPLTWHIRNCGLSPYGCMYMAYEDHSARLRVQYNKTFQSKFSDQAITNTQTIQWGQGQVITLPDGEAGSGIDYSVIRVIRDRWVSAGNDVRLQNEAKALAGAYYARFSTWRSVSDSMTLACDKGEKIIAVGGSPLLGWVTHPQEIDPWLVPAGLGCAVENIPRKWGRYATPNVKYLTERKYNFKSGELSLTFGMPRSLQEFIKFIQAFTVNRPTVLAESVYASVPYVDQDSTTVFGPSFSTTAVKDPSLTTGIPVMATQGKIDEGPMLNGGVVHPNLIADEGLEANFNVAIGSAGFQGAIKIIPGLWNRVEVLLGKGSGLVNDTAFLKVYRLPKAPSLVPEFLFEVNITNKRTLVDVKDFKTVQGEWILPEVVTPADVAVWASVSFHAVRDYPTLKLS